jgi:hypothetical protein
MVSPHRHEQHASLKQNKLLVLDRWHYILNIMRPILVCALQLYAVTSHAYSWAVVLKIYAILKLPNIKAAEAADESVVRKLETQYGKQEWKDVLLKWIAFPSAGESRYTRVPISVFLYIRGFKSVSWGASISYPQPNVKAYLLTASKLLQACQGMWFRW